MRRLLLTLGACLFAAWPAAAQSNVQNAQQQERPGGDLSRMFQQLAGETGPLWIAYAVPAQPDWNACCRDNRAGGQTDCGGCSFEERKGGATIGTSDHAAARIQLEGDRSAVILYRIEEGRLARVRAFSESCTLDAGGRKVYWLTGVDPVESVALLKQLVQAAGKTSGEERSARGLVTDELLAMMAHRAPEAITALIDLARNNPEPRVRSDALFWLAQRAGEKASGAITDAIANDPDTKVKERAVFALSQLPKDEGVPKLIEVARTNRNPRVRQQAVFWLGQSKDPRALAFFEEILLK